MLAIFIDFPCVSYRFVDDKKRKNRGKHYASISMQNSSSRLRLCVCQARDDLRRVGSSFPNSRGGFVSSELCRILPVSFDDTDAVFSSSDAVMSLRSSEMQSEPRFSNYFSSSSSHAGWLGVVAAPLRSTWDGACFYGLTEPLVQVYEQRRCGLLFV